MVTRRLTSALLILGAAAALAVATAYRALRREDKRMPDLPPLPTPELVRAAAANLRRGRDVTDPQELERTAGWSEVEPPPMSGPSCGFCDRPAEYKHSHVMDPAEYSCAAHQCDRCQLIDPAEADDGFAAREASGDG